MSLLPVNKAYATTQLPLEMTKNQMKTNEKRFDNLQYHVSVHVL